MNQINPWLSACDLAGPAPADLQGSCGPPEVPKYCPVACVASSKGNDGNGNDAEFVEVIEKVRVTGRNCYWSTGGKKEATTETAVAESERFDSSSIKSSGTDGGEVTSDKKGRTDREKAEGVRMDPEQCLFYLEESHKRDICRDDFGRTSTRSFLTPRENRYWFMSGLRLRHCCDHAVVNALAPGKGGPLENVLNGGQKCVDALDKLLHADVLAARLHCEFEEVLARYDCAQPYSVIFNCTHCKVTPLNALFSFLSILSSSFLPFLLLSFLRLFVSSSSFSAPLSSSVLVRPQPLADNRPTCKLIAKVGKRSASSHR